MEVGAADREAIWKAMNLPGDNFDPGYMRFSPHQQFESYQRCFFTRSSRSRASGSR